MSRLICLSCRALCTDGTKKQYSESIAWGGMRYPSNEVYDQCPHCEAIDELKEFDVDEALIEVDALTAAVRQLAGKNDPAMRAIEARIANVQTYLEEA